MLSSWHGQCDEADAIHIRWSTLVVVCLLLAILAYLVGWGGFTPQAGDWNKHNALMHDLIDCPWPVTFSNGDETSMLTYYVGQYLLPALFGKASGSFEVSVIVELIWNYIGLVLVYIGIVRVLHVSSSGRQFICLGVLVFFGGLIPAGRALINATMPELLPTIAAYHWFSYSGTMVLQYSPNIVLLRWVFNQTIVPWLVLLLFFEMKNDIRYYVPIALPMALYGILPFLGTILLMSAFAVFRLVTTKPHLEIVKSIFSPENLVCALSLGAVFLLYYAGNIFSVKPASIGISFITYSKHWPVYFIFVLFTFGIYSALIAHRFYRDPLFWICNVALLLIPLFHMGIYNDFVMRTSIPFLFLLMLMVCDYLVNCDLERTSSRIIAATLTICLLIASVTPIQELSDNEANDSLTDLTQSTDGFISLGYSANRSLEQKTTDLKYNYFSYDIDSNAFVQYLARKPIQPQVREDWR